MAQSSPLLLLVLLLAIAAVADCDPIFFSIKNSRESGRSRERASASTLRTVVDDSDENVGGKTIRRTVHVFHPLQKYGLNFGHEIIQGKPVLPINASDDISKVDTTIRQTDDDNSFDNPHDFNKIDEISVKDERLTTQKRTNQLGLLSSLRDVQATLRRKAHDAVSSEDKTDDSLGTDEVDEAVEKEKDDDLDISNEKNRFRNPLKISSSFGRSLKLSPSVSFIEPVTISVSTMSSVSSVVGKVLSPSSHQKGKDGQIKETSDRSSFNGTSGLNGEKETGSSDENEESSSAVELARKTTSRGRSVIPVVHSLKNQVKNSQSIGRKKNGRPVVIIARARAAGENNVGSKFSSKVEVEVSTEFSKEVITLEDIRKATKSQNFNASVSTKSAEKESKNKKNVRDVHIIGFDGSGEILSREIKVNDRINYNSPELDQSKEKSLKFKLPVLPEIVLPVPSSKTKVLEDISLESDEEHIKLLTPYRIPDPKPKNVLPAYIPSTEKHTSPLKSYRLSAPSSYPKVSALKLDLDDSDESEIIALKPVNYFQRTYAPRHQLTSEVVDIDSTEIFKGVSSYRPELLNFKHTEVESEEIVKPGSTSYLPLKSQKQFNSGELEIESDEYAIPKHFTHGTTTSYLQSWPLEYGLQATNYSPMSQKLARPFTGNTPSLSPHTFNIKLKSDEKSIEAVPDAFFFRKKPQHVFSQYSDKPLTTTKTFQVQKHSPTIANIASSSSVEFESDEIKIESDEATLKIIPAVRLASSQLPPSSNYRPKTQVTAILPQKSTSSYRKNPLSTLQSASLDQNHAHLTNFHKLPEISIGSVPDAPFSTKTPQHVFSQYSKPLATTKTSQAQKYSPAIPNIAFSSSIEFESDEIKLESDEATLKIIPTVRVSSPHSPPSLTAILPQKFTSSYRKNPLLTLQSASLDQNHAPLSNAYNYPKQTVVHQKTLSFPPAKQYPASLLTKQRLKSRPTVNFPYHQNSKATTAIVHPLKTVQNHRVVHNNMAFAPQLVSLQNFNPTVQPRPIQGLLLQPQQPMRYGGQFNQYGRQKGRAFNALLVTPLNGGINLNSPSLNNYHSRTYGLQQTNVPLQTVRQPSRTYPNNRRPNLNAGLINKKKKLNSAGSSLPLSSGFVNLGSVGVPLPRPQQPVKTFTTFSTDSDETIIQQSIPVVAPAYAAPVEASYQAPQKSYEAPAVCEPVIQYSVVTHDILVPTTVEVYRTKYLPTTQYDRVTETKYYAKPQVNVITVTSVPEPQIITKTEVANNPVYVAQTNYETVIKYLTATQANIVTDTRVIYKTQYNTITDVQYITQIQTQYETKTKYRTQYQTQTEINYQTKVEYQTQYLTSTAYSKVPVYNTVTETKIKQQYVTETVPSYRTETQIQEKYITQTVTSQYPFYTTVISTQYQPQYVTVTQQCNQGYGGVY